jgi:hypothetical protein
MTGLAAVLRYSCFCGAGIWRNRRNDRVNTVLFDPNILAHSSIIHTDIPFTRAFSPAAIFTGARLNA